MELPQNLNDWNEYRGMVHWFSPSVLIKTAKRVVDSELFGQYADRRLVQAALDSPIRRRTILRESFGGKKGICRRRIRPEIWVDYVADLGDGFDSTYSIAYLIGKKKIKVDDNELPRADCLIMGGDEVYPYASQEDYNNRMQRAYRAAFPLSNKQGSVHPPVYLIPGNHDWYDGLALFLGKFCRGRATSLGSWIARQRRSYFAIRLANNWWIWGFDSQLHEDIDKPQADYFVTVASMMEPNPNVILCASVPTWLKASLAATNQKEKDQFYRGLDYMALILRDKCEGARIPLAISGDLHHYSRYIAKESRTQFITAGGGGAFLHPTHFSVKDTITIPWAKTDQTLEIAETVCDNRVQKAIYPSQEKSRELAKGNIKFFYHNWSFSLLLGLLYWIFALLMLAWDGYDAKDVIGGFEGRLITQVMNLWPTPVFLLVVVVLFGVLLKTADIKSDLPKPSAKWLERLTAGRPKWERTLLVLRKVERVIAFLTSRRIRAVAVHFLAHLAIILLATATVTTTLLWLKSVHLWGELLYFVSVAAGMITSGFLGGLIWGIYLTVVSWLWGDEANNAFSAMRLDSFRHFIRLRIEGDKVTIYPISIDEAPLRKDWILNRKFDKNNPDQDEAGIIPTEELQPRLIEGPIVIDVNEVGRLIPRA